jgi:hypothetical protein
MIGRLVALVTCPYRLEHIIYVVETMNELDRKPAQWNFFIPRSCPPLRTLVIPSILHAVL